MRVLAATSCVLCILYQDFCKQLCSVTLVVLHSLPSHMTADTDVDTDMSSDTDVDFYKSLLQPLDPKEISDAIQCDDSFWDVYDVMAAMLSGSLCQFPDAYKLVRDLHVSDVHLQGFLRRSNLREWAFFFSRQCMSASSSVQSLSDIPSVQRTVHNSAAMIPCAIPKETVLQIISFVGTHNLKAIWPCSQCSPYWYGWYCTDCKLVSKYRNWSHKDHFGRCRRSFCSAHGDFCGCCRRAKGLIGCHSCDALCKLKGTCHTMRILLKTYSGT